MDLAGTRKLGSSLGRWKGIPMNNAVKVILILLLCGSSLAACSNNQGVNAASGALVGAAVGNQFGSGGGKTAATLAGAAIGAQAGANACGGANQPPC